MCTVLIHTHLTVRCSGYPEVYHGVPDLYIINRLNRLNRLIAKPFGFDSWGLVCAHVRRTGFSKHGGPCYLERLGHLQGPNLFKAAPSSRP